MLGVELSHGGVGGGLGERVFNGATAVDVKAKENKTFCL